jgi:hypothetical protein
MCNGRNVTLCGLYLNFASVRDFVESVKPIGLRSSDMSIILPDGSVMSVMPIPSEPQVLREAAQNRGTAYSARVKTAATALTKTLLTLGIPVYDSERLEYKIRNGGVLVSIRCSDSAIAQVREILIQTGAQDLSVARDLKFSPERSSGPGEQPYTSPATSGWQQGSAHA